MNVFAGGNQACVEMIVTSEVLEFWLSALNL